MKKLNRPLRVLATVALMSGVALSNTACTAGKNVELGDFAPGAHNLIPAVVCGGIGAIAGGAITQSPEGAWIGAGIGAGVCYIAGSTVLKDFLQETFNLDDTEATRMAGRAEDVINGSGHGHTKVVDRDGKSRVVVFNVKHIGKKRLLGMADGDGNKGAVEIKDGQTLAKEY